MPIKLLPVPAFNDNYVWLWWPQGSTEAWAVDPADAAPVQAALTDHGLTLAGILVTHHHPDHVGGIPTLRATWPVPVYGPAHSPAAEHFTQLVQDNGALTLAGTTWQVIGVPGHTLDHVAYYNEENQILFCGDTLFAAGCGRVFEGTLAQMHDSLQKLASLPDSTRVCCAHEYTLSNLRFAATVEPENVAITAALAHDAALRDAGKPTLPTTLARERATNPFLRASSASEFGSRRQWKNDFRG